MSIIGAAYAAVLAAFWFVLHLSFVSHVRGSGVRLGPNQLPELHERVVLLCSRMGLERVPEAYLMQASGSLNAFATRFFRSNMIVLFSDLLEACGSNEAARDMIIAHELGHIRAGHLRWRWLTMPAMIVPFLAMALSRAREYTCDRIGLAGATDTDGALLGLTILAAGGQYGRQVNREAMVAQRVHLASGWMTIGEWLSTHPPLARRLVALEPSLGLGQRVGSGAPRAVGIMLLLVLGTLAVGVAGVRAFQSASQLVLQQHTESTVPGAADENALTLAATSDLSALAAFLDDEIAAGRALPANGGELIERWTTLHGAPPPADPFDGFDYGYDVAGGSYIVWSSGPDGMSGTEDDISETSSP